MKYYVRNTGFSIRILVLDNTRQQLNCNKLFFFKIKTIFNTVGIDNLKIGDIVSYPINYVTVVNTEDEAIGFATMEFL